jgi:hypothetical protein
MPIDAVHFDPLAPVADELAVVAAPAALELAELLLLLFELPQPAAINATSAAATSVKRTFMAC